MSNNMVLRFFAKCNLEQGRIPSTMCMEMRSSWFTNTFYLKAHFPNDFSTFYDCTCSFFEPRLFSSTPPISTASSENQKAGRDTVWKRMWLILVFFKCFCCFGVPGRVARLAGPGSSATRLGDIQRARTPSHSTTPTHQHVSQSLKHKCLPPQGLTQAKC